MDTLRENVILNFLHLYVLVRQIDSKRIQKKNVVFVLFRLLYLKNYYY